MSEQRECRKCHNPRPVDDFYVASRTGKARTWCKGCVKENVTAWQRANKDRFSATQRRSALKRKYRLTEEDVAQLLADQGGSCAICGSMPESNATLHVDHCHATGRVRGLLCNKCNRALGYFRDSPQTLLRAAAYLRASTPK